MVSPFVYLPLVCLLLNDALGILGCNIRSDTTDWYLFSALDDPTVSPFLLPDSQDSLLSKDTQTIH
jgi:hypothetical protein